MRSIPVRRIKNSGAGSIPGRFSIRDLQQVLNGAGLDHELHRHDFYFVLLILKGKGAHEIDFDQYPVHDAAVFLLRPGQVHRLQLAANSTGYLMEFDLAFYQPKNSIKEQRWRKAAAKNYCKPETARFRKLDSCLAAILSEYNLKEEGYVEAIKAHLDLFFLDYIRQSKEPGKPAKAATIYLQERFEELTGLLESRISEVKSVAGFAQLLNLSPYQLNAISKASVGKTVSQLIDEQILLEAKRQLLATPAQVKDIAGQLGYDDVSYFIRFFKKHTGQSPELFRKNFK